MSEVLMATAVLRMSVGAEDSISIIVHYTIQDRVLRLRALTFSLQGRHRYFDSRLIRSFMPRLFHNAAASASPSYTHS